MSSKDERKIPLSQQIEIEFKNLLTQTEYHHLQQYFKIEQSQIKKQINHYFDTKDFSLKTASSALRIREKGNRYELTLKQPAEVGLLETNQTLSHHEAQAMFKNAQLPEGPVKSILDSTDIDDQLEYFGSLTTYRSEIDYQGGLLVFDHSLYLNVEDFEVEYEVTSEECGKQIFKQLLESMNIPFRKTDNKVRRFYQRKYEQ